MSRILVDLGPAAGAHGARGIGRYVRGLALALGAMEDSLAARVVTCGGDGLDGSSVGTRLEVERWRPQDIGWLTGWVGDSRLARRAGASAFHATDPRKALRPLGMRLVATVYDLIPLLDPAVADRVRAHRRLVHRLYLASVRRAERIVAISHATAGDVATHLGVPLERIDVVYPVIQAPERALPWIPAEEPTFVAIGVPDPHKQPDLAIRALAAFRARAGAGRLRFIGPAPASQVAGLRALAEQLGVGPWVDFSGPITDEDLEAAYAGAHAVLALSRREGFGLPAVEAAIRGTPVVAVDTPVARETLGDAAPFVPSDVDAVVEAMERARPPAAAARDALLARHRPEAVAASLATPYRSVLDG